jgi:simple sugar transport system ATP-binding protein
MKAKDTILTIDGVSKLFGEFKALDKVSVNVERGTVHAILGENGAGKTTLMNIVYGLYQPDGGGLYLNDREVHIESPHHAVDLGIGMIHQHFMLVDTLTVTENIIMGLKGLGFTLDLPTHEKRIRKLSEEFDFEVDPSTEIWRLPMGMRQRVEILKALYRDAELLILDEPTSVLAPTEIDSLLVAMDRLKKAGKTIMFITHKLEEVLEVGDRITVMRDGKMTAEKAAKDTNAKEIARLMVGRDVVFDIHKPECEIGDTVLEVRNANAQNERDLQALFDVSLSVRSGEILGVAGVDGNGQAELAEVIAGLRELSSGEVLINNENIEHLTIAQRRHNYQLGFVPEDRQGTALVLDFPVSKNCILRDFAKPPFSNRMLLNRPAMETAATEWVKKYDIRLHSIDQHARFLSGGNQQKLIVAREIESKPKILLVMQPCKGLDVGAIEAVQNIILEQKVAGKAILYISTEFEHILEVADRIAVMCRGKITGVVTPAEATPEVIGTLMGGSEGCKI